MKTVDKVSIIVPCFNQAHFLDEALCSVFEQTYENWECIIVNDGSTDSTEIVAKRWCQKDTRFLYTKKENGGLSSARNAGLDLASGHFIQFLDSDDCLAPNKLELSLKSVHTSNRKTTSIVITNFRTFSKKENETSDPYCALSAHYFNFNDVLVKWPAISIPIHCGMFHSKLFLNFRFPEDLKAFEDWVMWLNLFKGDSGVKFIDQPLAFYRRHNGSMTVDNHIMDQNLRRAIMHIKELVSEEEYIYLSFRELQQNEIKYRQLQRKLHEYEISRVNIISAKLKKFWLGKFSLKMLTKIYR